MKAIDGIGRISRSRSGVARSPGTVDAESDMRHADGEHQGAPDEKKQEVEVGTTTASAPAAAVCATVASSSSTSAGQYLLSSSPPGAHCKTVWTP